MFIIYPYDVSSPLMPVPMNTSATVAIQSSGPSAEAKRKHPRDKCHNAANMIKYVPSEVNENIRKCTGSLKEGFSRRSP